MERCRSWFGRKSLTFEQDTRKQRWRVCPNPRNTVGAPRLPDETTDDDGTLRRLRVLRRDRRSRLQEDFPALQAMARRGRLDLPVIGVAKSGWTRDQFVERARGASAETRRRGSRRPSRSWSLLRYVDGDYTDPDTFARLRGSSASAAPGPLSGDSAEHVPLVIGQLADAELRARTRASSSRSRSGAISRRRRN